MGKLKKYWKRGLITIQKVVVVLILSTNISCNSENASDCLQTAGDLVREEIAVPEFSKITVFEKVALVLSEGEAQKVELETGENLREEVSISVEGDRLILRNENGCNLFRDYGLTTVYVTSPNITELRSSTGLPIKSNGVLAYPSLTLLSESFTVPEAETTDGEFDLDVNTGTLRVVVNGIAYFKLRGTSENFNINIAAGDSRIEAQELLAQTISLNHRGSNDMLVNPQSSISGTIRGNGDVISYNRPEVVDVTEIFNGRLIFKD